MTRTLTNSQIADVLDDIHRRLRRQQSRIQDASVSYMRTLRDVDDEMGTVERGRVLEITVAYVNATRSHKELVSMTRKLSVMMPGPFHDRTYDVIPPRKLDSGERTEALRKALDGLGGFRSEFEKVTLAFLRNNAENIEAITMYLYVVGCFDAAIECMETLVSMSGDNGAGGRARKSGKRR